MAINSRTRSLLAVLLFLLSFLSGTGALNIAFVKEGHALFAVSTFLVASILWSSAYRLIRSVQSRLRIVGFAILALWIINLVIAAIANMSETVRNPFFWISSAVLISLILLHRRPRVSESRAEAGE